MAGEKLRHHFGDYLVKAEVFIYSVLAVLLFAAALATIADATKMLWEGLRHWTIANQTLRVLDHLLVVLMLVEILHTVRISIHSHTLITEPFLVVGLIASIRRILVITLEASTLTKKRRNLTTFLTRASVPLRLLRLILVKRRQEPVRVLAQNKIRHRNPQFRWIASADPHLSLLPQPVLQIHPIQRRHVYRHNAAAQCRVRRSP